jgi:hypothetical protein
MNKHTFIAYITNALILLFVSGVSVILSRKYNFTLLITETFQPGKELEISDSEIKQESSPDSELITKTFQQGKELEISDSEIEQEFYPDSANLSKPLPIKEDLVSDSSDNIEYIKQLISDKNFVIEVFSTFSVLLIGSTLFAIFR